MQSVDYSEKALQWLLDLVFPPICIGCRRYPTDQQSRYVCRSCFRTIPVRRTFECIGCKIPVKVGIPCATCAPFTAVNRLLIASTYKDVLLQRIITNYKYKFIRELETSLGQLLRKYTAMLLHHHHFNLFASTPTIIPVPLHPYRQRWRGFNQAELLGRHIADLYQMPFALALIKSRRTTPQAQLSEREERLDHLDEVFSCPDPNQIKDKDILLVDDVCTTGATLDACAEVLKANGARSVTGFVVARG